MEENRSGRIKIWLFVLGICVMQWAVYVLTGVWLDRAGIMYRSWISFLESVIVVFVMIPLAFACIILVLDGIGLKKKWRTRIVGSRKELLVFLCVIEVCLGSLFFLLFWDSFERERKITSDVLAGITENPFGVGTCSYYKPYGLLMKKKYDHYEEPVVLAVLGNRYGKKVKTADFYQMERTDGLDYCVYELVPEGEPDMCYHVVPSAGVVPEYMDDYKETKAIKRAEEYVKEHSPERFREVEDAEYGVLKHPGIICNGREDMADCAEAASGMIAYVLEDSFFQKYGTDVMVMLNSKENGTRMIALNVGKRYNASSSELAGYYSQEDHVYEALVTAYDIWDKEISNGNDH